MTSQKENGMLNRECSSGVQWWIIKLFSGCVILYRGAQIMIILSGAQRMIIRLCREWSSCYAEKDYQVLQRMITRLLKKCLTDDRDNNVILLGEWTSGCTENEDHFVTRIIIGLYREVLWCNGYRRRKWTRRHEFKSWTRLIAFHIALIPLGKVWIQLFSFQIWVNSRAD